MVTSGRELVKVVAGGRRGGHRWEACLFTPFLYLPSEFCVLSKYQLLKKKNPTFTKFDTRVPVPAHPSNAVCVCQPLSHGTTFCDPTRLLCPQNSPGKNTGVGSHSLFQGIFLTQGSNPGLLHCRQILYCLSYQGRPSNAILKFIFHYACCYSLT